jgi:hypothetical protein
MLVYDITDRNSFAAVRTWMAEIQMVTSFLLWLQFQLVINLLHFLFSFFFIGY